MAALDLAALAGPVSDAEPCGPDLDLSGDPDFAQFVARADGVFPTSFFTRDGEGRLQVFDRTSIDFASEFRLITPLLGTTRDLRLLTIYGRLLALNRDLDGFATCIDAVATLVRDRWDEVNPRGEDGDYSLRGAVLQGFDDNPTVVLPLQHLPLVESRRSGQISYRSVMVAAGEVKPRDDEPALDRATIDRAFAEADLDALKLTGERLHKVLDATSVIQVSSIEKAGYEQAVSLEKLPALVTKMAGVVDAAIAARDPNALPPPSGAAAEAGAGSPSGAPAVVMVASAVPTGRVATAADVQEALAAVSKYFGSTEPSNPAGLLVEQALRLMGKSFAEVVRLMVPSIADQARINLGTDKLFGLTLDQLPDVSDAWSSYQSSNGSGGHASGWGEDAASAETEGDGSVPEAPPSAPPIEAKTRADAAALLEQVGAYFRLVEPSSPVPLLTDRARGLLERDFLTILKDVLPELVPRPPE